MAGHEIQQGQPIGRAIRAGKIGLINFTLNDVLEERLRQERVFPDQHLEDGTSEDNTAQADYHKEVCEAHRAEGSMTWADVLAEEFWEAMSEKEPELLRAELIQVAAVAARWVEDIDNRNR